MMRIFRGYLRMSPFTKACVCAFVCSRTVWKQNSLPPTANSRRMEYAQYRMAYKVCMLVNVLLQCILSRV